MCDIQHKTTLLINRHHTQDPYHRHGLQRQQQRVVRTKTLVKNAIVSIDSTPFRQWYEAHYALPIGRKKGAKLVRIGPEIERIKPSSALLDLDVNRQFLWITT